jgi:hypothetical protein
MVWEIEEGDGTLRRGGHVIPPPTALTRGNILVSAKALSFSSRLLVLVLNYLVY